jgi:hypothetical protein
MNRRNIWLIIPSALLPCVLLLTLVVIFFSGSLPFPDEYLGLYTIFGQGVILHFFVYALVSVPLAVTCFVLCITKKYDSLSIAKTAMIIKLAQIPVFIVIFVLGVLFFITIFTMAFSFVMFLVDVCTVFATGLLTLAAVINASKSGEIPIKRSFWVIILQCVFCLDVVAAVIFYIQLKNERRRASEHRALQESATFE